MVWYGLLEGWTLPVTYSPHAPQLNINSRAWWTQTMRALLKGVIHKIWFQL